MRKLQDVLRKHILREALDPIAVVELEKALALLDEQRADGYCELRPDRPPADALPHLGLLRRMVERAQQCFIEQYSKTPSLEEAEDALYKVATFHQGLKKAALKKAAKGARVPKPELWLVSPGRPKQVLEDYRGLPDPDWPRGVYRCPKGNALWVIVLSELPKTAETRALRMFGQPAMQLEVLRELNALSPSDPQNEPWVDILADVRYLIEQVPDLSPEEQTIMTELRQRWEREKTELRAAAMAEGQAELRQRWEREKTELRTAAMAEGQAELRQRWEREKTELRTAAMAEGQAKGKAEGILTMLRARGLSVSESVRTRVLGCKDLSMLDRWLVRAASAGSDTDVTL